MPVKASVCWMSLSSWKSIHGAASYWLGGPCVERVEISRADATESVNINFTFMFLLEFIIQGETHQQHCADYTKALKLNCYIKLL